MITIEADTEVVKNHNKDRQSSKIQKPHNKPKESLSKGFENRRKQQQEYKKADSLGGFEESVDQSQDKVMIFDQDEDNPAIEKQKNKNKGI